MAIKHIICSGIGFATDGVKFIPTRGFDSKVLVQGIGGQNVSNWIWWPYIGKKR